MCYFCFELGEWNNILRSGGRFDHCLLVQPPPPPLVFLHVSVLDIDQLNCIMLLVGTPGPEILTKMSSDSVSVSYHPAPFCHSALLPVLMLHLRQTRCYSISYTYLDFCVFSWWLDFCSCAFLPTCAMNYKSVVITQRPGLRFICRNNPSSCFAKAQKSPSSLHGPTSPHKPP